jgi:hypothetical protein
VPAGISIGHFRVTAGTLGCLVQDRDGNRFILSNNHVLADENKAEVGDVILQAGVPMEAGAATNATASAPLLVSSVST